MRITGYRKDNAKKTENQTNKTEPDIAGASLGPPLLAQGRGVPEVFSKTTKKETLHANR